MAIAPSHRDRERPVQDPGPAPATIPQQRKAHQKSQDIIEGMYLDARTTEDETRQNEDDSASSVDLGRQSETSVIGQSDDLTRAFVRLANLPTYPLDRLSRYKATLWRQACQILFALRCLSQSRPWKRLRLR
jgi:hypothetical protein